MRISDWSSDVCSSDLLVAGGLLGDGRQGGGSSTQRDGRGQHGRTHPRQAQAAHGGQQGNGRFGGCDGHDSPRNGSRLELTWLAYRTGPGRLSRQPEGWLGAQIAVEPAISL